MERLYSKIVGMPVFAPDSPRPIHTVEDLVFDPVNGKIIAFVVGRGLMIAPMDVLSLKHGVLIRDRGDVVEIEDVLRVRDVVDGGKWIVGKRVFTLEGKALGKVVDTAVDDLTLVLSKIYTARVFLGILQSDARVIPANRIVEVLADRIVVKDDSGFSFDEVAEKEVERGTVGAVV